MTHRIVIEMGDRRLVLTTGGIVAEKCSDGWTPAPLTAADRQALLESRDMIQTAIYRTTPTFCQQIGL